MAVALAERIERFRNPFFTKVAAEDLQAQTRQEVARARDAVSTARELLDFDLLEGALRIDVRSTQAPGRHFGEASARLWEAIRRLTPRRRLSAPALRAEPDQPTIARFLTEHSAQEFTTAPLPRQMQSIA